MEKQIFELRQALKDADMDDEQREAAEATLTALETSINEEREAREVEAALAAEVTEEQETDSRKVGSAVEDAIVALTEVSRSLAEGQTVVLEEITAMRVEATKARELELEWEEEAQAEGQEEESRSTSNEEMLASIEKLTRTVEETIPQRRGAGANAETVNPLDESARLEEAVSNIKDPIERLRAIAKHVTGERKLV